MNGAHALLVLLLVVNAVQVLLAAAAFVQGARRERRDELELARYSRRHAALLLVAGLVLSVPPVLGLTGVVATRTAVWVTIAGEVIAFAFARRHLPRLHTAAYGSPGAPASAASTTAASATEGAAETADS